MKVSLALGRTPADKLVAGGTLPGVGAKAEQGEERLACADKVAQLGAGQGFVAEVVVTVDVLFIPQT